MREIIIATKNDKKLRELRRYLRGIKADVYSLKELQDVPRIIENGKTFEANAVKKARTISRFTKGLVLADDSGLEVKALGGKPGVISARFAGPQKNDHKNNEKVLALLKGLPLKKRAAQFVCAIAIADHGHIIKTIEENCKGLIDFSIKGRHGFGYDAIFYIPKYRKTFGQLGLKVKDKMSHRSKALRKTRAFLKDYL